MCEVEMAASCSPYFFWLSKSCHNRISKQKQQQIIIFYRKSCLKSLNVYIKETLLTSRIHIKKLNFSEDL